MAKFDRYIISATATDIANDDYNLILEILFEDGDIVADVIEIATTTIQTEKERIENPPP
jgi:hypothetical protein